MQVIAPSVHLPLVKFLVYRTSSIGDCILALSCIEFIQKLDVRYRIYWVSREPMVSFIKTAFPEVIVLAEDEFASGVSSGLLSENLNFVINLQGNLRSKKLCHKLAKQMNCPTYEWPKESLKRSWLVTMARLRGRLKELPEYSFQYKFSSMVDVLKLALIKQLGEDYQLAIETQTALPNLDREKFKNLPTIAKQLQVGCWIAIAPGASYPTKQAPYAFVVEVLKQLKEYFYEFKRDVNLKRPQLVFLGDESDRTVAQSIISELEWPSSVLNMCGRARLEESASMIMQTKVLLSNDSSLTHIAEALKTPTACLFGPTLEAFGFATHLPRSKTFSAPLGCRPCSKHGKTECRYGDKKCFEDIDKKAVAKYLIQTIENEA